MREWGRNNINEASQDMGCMHAFQEKWSQLYSWFFFFTFETFRERIRRWFVHAICKCALICWFYLLQLNTCGKHIVLLFEADFHSRGFTVCRWLNGSSLWRWSLWRCARMCGRLALTSPPFTGIELCTHQISACFSIKYQSREHCLTDGFLTEKGRKIEHMWGQGKS